MAARAGKWSKLLMTGPLAPFVQAYVFELGMRGYTASSAGVQLRQVARLNTWMQERGVTAAQLSDRRVDRFMAWQRTQGHDRHCSRRGLGYLQDALADAGVLDVDGPASVASPADVVLASFEQFLLVERGLTVGSVSGYVRHVRRFLDGLPPDVGLSQLAPAMVTAAVLAVASSGVSVSAAQLFVSGLRSFLRFCFMEGLVGADLSGAALPVRGRRQSLLPKAMHRSDAILLLGSCDRRTGVGRRDYAMMLLMLRLGLRRCEVVALELDDIDWSAGELAVRGKGGRTDRLPLPADVGKAITAYLRHGRPASGRRELFLRTKAPRGPLASGAVGSMVRRASGRAGIDEVGAHRLRHTLACEMVAADVPLQQIGQVLRHRSLQSTSIYARVDVSRLRLLARPWPQGAER